jgi:hypothetical protein
MSNTLPVRITTRKITTGEIYEGTVSMCGGRPFKLVRKSDDSTQFPTRSAVVGAARNFAKTYGFADVNFDDAAKAKVAAKTTATKSTATKATATKKAAKKSSVATSRTATPTQAQTQTSTSVSRPTNSR